MTQLQFDFLLKQMPNVESKITRAYVRQFSGRSYASAGIHAKAGLKYLKNKGYCDYKEKMSEKGDKVIKRTWFVIPQPVAVVEQAVEQKEAP